MAALSIRGQNMTFQSDDGWNTPAYAWKAIAHLIPKDKVIWEPFLLNNISSTSVEDLKDLGFQVIGDHTVDFFNADFGDVIVSNPPYSIKKKIFERLALLDKPFILILPIATISKQFVRFLKRDLIQLIITPKRMHFVKENIESSRAWFDTCYFCYKMNLPNDITYL